MPPTDEERPSLSSECKKCVNNLMSTLQSIQSKPMTLLKSMGVEISSFEQNATGVLVHLPESTTQQHRNISHVSENNKKEVEAFGGTPPAASGSGSESSSSINIDNKNGDILGEVTKKLTQSFGQISPPSSQSIPVATSATTKPGVELLIKCRKCGNDGPEGAARAYVAGPYPLSIILCSNRLYRKEDMDEVLVHELMHVYDVHYRNWDLTNCHTLAKSEVRAAREAECADTTMSFTKRYCAKERAKVATGNMFPDLGNKCVAAVFEEAMEDKAPFSDHKGSRESRSDGYNVDGRSFQSSYAGDKVTPPYTS